MINPRVEMRLLAGKVALLLAGIYCLMFVALAVAVGTHETLPLLEWVLVPLPSVAFAPAVVAAIQLHRTSDPARQSRLWRRSLLLAGVGFGLFVAVAMIAGQLN
ncbi:hypothetical protein ACFFWC_08200 [Plantactinospora siamensis]|uniref:Uncharacterized protein n=1 Tax=Plantactinospora siamensis TaxID=555372 RepID=A0ABV6P3U6_9ACTN